MRFTNHILLVFINEFKFSDVCCTYMNNYYQPGDNITTSLASDNCTQVRFTYLTVLVYKSQNLFYRHSSNARKVPMAQQLKCQVMQQKTALIH